MKTVYEWESEWKVIEAQLPAGWREQAAEHGVAVEGPRTRGTKVSDPAVVLRAVLHHACAGASLKVTAGLVATMLGVQISAAALHKWMIKSGPWLAAMLASMLETAPRFRRERWAGYDVIAADATTVQRPGARAASSRVHLATRLSNLEPVHIKATGPEVGETMRRFPMRKGQLWLYDRGYSNAPGIQYAHSRGADVIVRYTPRSLPLFDPKGQPIDVQKRLDSSLRLEGRQCEWKVWIHPADGEPIAGRLVAVRLQREQQAKARARAEREYGKGKLSKEVKRMLPYVVLFTTVPEERLTPEQVIELYRLRWQVELSIKRDKSICDLDALPNFRPDTIYTWLCAKLLGVELARRLSRPNAREPFPPEAIGIYALRPRLALASDVHPTRNA